MKLPIKSIMACGQGLEEYDLTDADGVLLGTIYDWASVVQIVAAVNAHASSATPRADSITEAALKAFKRYVWRVRNPKAPIAGAAALDAAMADLLNALVAAGVDVGEMPVTESERPVDMRNADV